MGKLSAPESVRVHRQQKRLSHTLPWAQPNVQRRTESKPQASLPELHQQPIEAPQKGAQELGNRSAPGPGAAPQLCSKRRAAIIVCPLFTPLPLLAVRGVSVKTVSAVSYVN